MGQSIARDLGLYQSEEDEQKLKALKDFIEQKINRKDKMSNTSDFEVYYNNSRDKQEDSLEDISIDESNSANQSIQQSLKSLKSNKSSSEIGPAQTGRHFDSMKMNTLFQNQNENDQESNKIFDNNGDQSNKSVSQDDNILNSLANSDFQEQNDANRQIAFSVQYNKEFQLNLPSQSEVSDLGTIFSEDSSQQEPENQEFQEHGQAKNNDNNKKAQSVHRQSIDKRNSVSKNRQSLSIVQQVKNIQQKDNSDANSNNLYKMDKSKKHQNKRNHIVIEIPEDSSCEIIEKHQKKEDKQHQNNNITNCENQIFIHLEENIKHSVPQQIDDIIMFESENTENVKNNKNSIQNTIQDEQEYAPWVQKKTLKIKNPLYRLHNEIIELTEYLLPTEQEHNSRKESLENLKNIILSAVPDCEIKIFGSFITGLYLPNSDIDIVIVKSGESNKVLYKKVADKILTYESIYQDINLVTHAKVPIIKFVEKSTQIGFDISFNKEDGVKQLSEVKKGLQIYPEIKYLIMIMKCVLRQRDLHETYTGGIGSFLLFCMILAFLRELRKEYDEQSLQKELQNISLGEYLLKLFRFFGNFDVERKRIIMHQGGFVYIFQISIHLIHKGAIINKDDRDKRFSLMSPQEPQHDIGNSSFKIRECIFPLFKNRFQFFTNYNFKQGESVLKYLVNPSNNTFTFLKEEK